MQTDQQVRTRSKTAHRRRVLVRGAVQGVGFRPFVYREATLELSDCNGVRAPHRDRAVADLVLVDQAAIRSRIRLTEDDRPIVFPRTRCGIADADLDRPDPDAFAAEVARRAMMPLIRFQSPTVAIVEASEATWRVTIDVQGDGVALLAERLQ